MFTEAFVDDCNLIYKELKRKPRGKRNFSISLKSNAALSSNQDDMNKTGASMQQPPGTRVNNATFIGKIIKPRAEKSVPIESPRNQRYQSVNEYDQYSKVIDE